MKSTALSILSIALLLCLAPAGMSQNIDNSLPPGGFNKVDIPGPPIPPSGSRSWSDDFNRASGTNMGADWNEMSGDIGISANMGYGIASGMSLMEHTSASAAYDAHVQAIDFLPKHSGSNLVYVALVSGLASSSTNIFIKVQDNDSDGLYDRVFFYSGNNGGPWSGYSPSYYYDLAVKTPSGRMFVYFTGGGDVANLDIDRDFDGTVDESFTCSGVLGIAGLGTGFGIGTYNSPQFDNWEVNGGGGYNLAVSPTPIIGGQNVTFTVTNGTANTMTYLVYSVTGTGSVYVPQLGITLGIANPTLGFAKPSDGSGTTIWSVTCPTGYTGPAWLQACQMGLASNVVATSVL